MSINEELIKELEKEYRNEKNPLMSRKNEVKIKMSKCTYTNAEECEEYLWKGKCSLNYTEGLCTHQEKIIADVYIDDRAANI